MENEELFTHEDIHRLTRWSMVTVYKKSRLGEIPGRIKLGPRSVRFKKSIVLEWLEAQKDAA